MDKDRPDFEKYSLDNELFKPHDRFLEIEAAQAAFDKWLIDAPTVYFTKYGGIQIGQCENEAMVIKTAKLVDIKKRNY